MKGSGWGCGLIVLFLLIFSIGFVIDMAAQETAQQQLGEGIVEQAKGIQELGKAVNTQAETIGEMGSEIVDTSQDVRMQNKMLIGAVIVMSVALLAVVLRRPAKVSEA